ncbi:MAG: sigma-70 family RNA polymerase sigma factor [Dehalococcoidia bacterium]|nr:sigma-70 family RNA polymerase sigma factor [Dehalococcoidia bacterium]
MPDHIMFDATLTPNQLQAEKELVKRAQHSPEAFGELYEVYYRRIFNYALKRTANVQLALDITSITFLKAFSQIKKYHWRDVPFAAWLYRIASNEVNDHYRREGGRRVSSIESIADLADTSDYSDEINQAEEELSRHEEFIMLHQKISELPFIYQEVIALKFFEKKKIREMVKILGKKEGTIKSLLHRGVEKLREKMK